MCINFALGIREIRRVPPRQSSILGFELRLAPRIVASSILVNTNQTAYYVFIGNCCKSECVAHFKPSTNVANFLSFSPKGQAE